MAAIEHDDHPHTREICPSCNGSGEGRYEGTRCRRCGGSGEVWTECEQEIPEWKFPEYWEV